MKELWKKNSPRRLKYYAKDTPRSSKNILLIAKI